MNYTVISLITIWLGFLPLTGMQQSPSQGSLVRLLPNSNEQRLIAAVKENKEGQINQYIQAAAWAVDLNNNNPLYFAHTSDVTERLIKKGANPNHRNNEGQTPMHVTRNRQIAHVLLDNRARLDVRDRHGNTPLHVAANAEMVNFLIERGADPRAQNFLDQQPIHTLTDPSALEALLNRNLTGVTVMTTDARGQTPLHTAQNEQVVTILIGRDAIIHARDQYGRTPLHTARNEHVAAALIDHFEGGVNPINLRNFIMALDRDNNTPLHLTTHRSIAQLLLARGADISARNNQGLTPLGRLCWSLIQVQRRVFQDMLIDLIRFLIEHNATVDRNNPDQREVIRHAFPDQTRQRELLGDEPEPVTPSAPHPQDTNTDNASQEAAALPSPTRSPLANQTAPSPVGQTAVDSTKKSGCFVL